MTWLLPAFGGFLFYGLWAFLIKLSGLYIQPKWTLLYEVLGVALVSVTYLAMTQSEFVFDQKGSGYGFLAGVLGATGGLFFYTALQRGKASVVIPIVTLYPLIPIFLGILVLHEVLTTKQAIGVVFALIAMVLLAHE